MTNANENPRGLPVAWLRDQIPRRVESDAFGDLDAEQMSIFDNGYNAALTRVHNLLNMASAALDNGGCPTATGSAFGGLPEAALLAELDALRAKLREANDALAEYANPDNWCLFEGKARLWFEPDTNTPDAYAGYELASKAQAAISAMEGR